jgi:hypothetical protein
MPRQQDTPAMWDGVSMEEAFTIWTAIVTGHAACFWPFLRCNFGTRAFSVSGQLAVVVMFLYGAFYPCPAMVPFAALWLVLVILHRIITTIRRMRGWETHSLFSGVPWVVRSLFFWLNPRDLVATGACEPVLVLIAGTLLCTLSESLGFFVMAGSVSLAVRRLLERSIEEAQLRSIRDNEFEMQALMARYRGRP